MTKQPKYVPLSEIKRDHRFSDRLVRKLLGEPDKQIPHPGNSKKYQPLKCYSLERVEKAKECKDWIDYQPSFKRRSEVSKKVQATKRQKTMNWVNATKIKWLKHPTNIKKGHEAAVKDLRHNYLDYNDKIDATKGKTGYKEARLQIKIRYNEVIGARYPALRKECERQNEKARTDFASAPDKQRERREKRRMWCEQDGVI